MKKETVTTVRPRKDIKWLTLTAVGAAIICVLAPWKIPAGPVPFTLATFAIYLISSVLGSAKGSAATAIYILLGAVGVPVFSGFMGGFHMVTGVTGGYILGYVPLAFITGFFAERVKKTVGYAVGMIAGTVLLYAFGTAWYCFAAKCALLPAITACVLPFLGIDALKIAAVSFLAAKLRPHMGKLS